jgi:hypothetical protein
MLIPARFLEKIAERLARYGLSSSTDLRSAPGFSVPLIKQLRRYGYVEDAGGSNGGSYRAKAVHFDGTVTLGTLIETALAADSPLGLASIWVKDIATGIVAAAMLSDGIFSVLNTSGIGSAFAAVAGDGDNVIEGMVASGPPSGWSCGMMAWDTNFASGSRVVQIAYGDTVQIVILAVDAGDAFAILYSNVDRWFFGAVSTFLSTSGDEADLQLWCGVTADLTDVNVRRKFIDGNGKPVDPAIAATAFGPQTVLLSGDKDNFATNQGTGPATGVLAGTITDASTSPSD